jgi:hypothetical protein
MKFTIQVLIESPDALPVSLPIQTIERSCARIEDVGLRLEAARTVKRLSLSHVRDKRVTQFTPDEFTISNITHIR